MAATVVIMVLVGAAIGVLSGLIGVGGGTVMVPVFRLALGMSPVSATGTSLFTIIPTSFAGTVSHVRNKTCIPKLGAALGLGGACTSPLGVWLAQVSPGWLVIGAAAAVIMFSAITMLQKALKMKPDSPASALDPKGPASALDPQGPAPNAGGVGELSETTGFDAGAVHGAAAAPTSTSPGSSASLSLSRLDYARSFGIGLLTGVVSGYVGLGGGFLMVPLMTLLLKFPMKLASGTSLIAIMIIALPGAVFQCMLGNVDYLAGIAVACGSIPGALLGARLMPHVPERGLRFIFAGFLGVAAILMMLKETGVLW